jgi:hypothetical protein
MYDELDNRAMCTLHINNKTKRVSGILNIAPHNTLAAIRRQGSLAVAKTKYRCLHLSLLPKWKSSVICEVWLRSVKWRDIYWVSIHENNNRVLEIYNGRGWLKWCGWLLYDSDVGRGIANKELKMIEFYKKIAIDVEFSEGIWNQQEHAKFIGRKKKEWKVVIMANRNCLYRNQLHFEQNKFRIISITFFIQPELEP